MLSTICPGGRDLRGGHCACLLYAFEPGCQGIHTPNLESLRLRHLLAPRQGAQERILVGVIQVTADRQTEAYTCNFNSQWL